MSRYQDAFDAHQRARFMRPDAHRWIRPDAARFLAPGTDPASVYPALAPAETKYNPNQPRVPKGNGDESGQWTVGGGGQGYDARLASSDRPRLGRQSMALVMLEAAKRLIDGYRSDNLLKDFLGGNPGTVGVTVVDGKEIYGSSSSLPSYSAEDDNAARRMRDVLIEKYPEIMSTKDLGEIPNDALFHAESTVLLRAARSNNGTLTGQELEIFIDRRMCNPSCPTVLPYLGLELGDPKVTFVGPKGQRRTMKGGRWLE